MGLLQETETGKWDASTKGQQAEEAELSPRWEVRE